jgi:hypothetical protein
MQRGCSAGEGVVRRCQLLCGSQGRCRPSNWYGDKAARAACCVAVEWAASSAQQHLPGTPSLQLGTSAALLTSSPLSRCGVAKLGYFSARCSSACERLRRRRGAGCSEDCAALQRRWQHQQIFPCAAAASPASRRLSSCPCRRIYRAALRYKSYGVVSMDACQWRSTAARLADRTMAQSVPPAKRTTPPSNSFVLDSEAIEATARGPDQHESAVPRCKESAACKEKTQSGRMMARICRITRPAVHHTVLSAAVACAWPAGHQLSNSAKLLRLQSTGCNPCLFNWDATASQHSQESCAP